MLLLVLVLHHLLVGAATSSPALFASLMLWDLAVLEVNEVASGAAPPELFSSALPHRHPQKLAPAAHVLPRHLRIIASRLLGPPDAPSSHPDLPPAGVLQVLPVLGHHGGEAAAVSAVGWGPPGVWVPPVLRGSWKKPPL